MKRKTFAIELGHTGIKTNFQDNINYIPFTEKAPSYRDKYVEYYLKKGNFFENAMTLAGVKEDDKIQLNTIVPRYLREKDVEAFISLIEDIKINNKNIDIESMFIGQGQSAFIDYIKSKEFTKEGLENSGYRSVIDIGWNQLQFLFMLDGEEQSNLYYKNGYGIKYLIFKIQEELKAQHSLELTENKALYYLKQYINQEDEVHPYKENIEDAIDSYLSYLFTFELDRKIQDRIEDTSVVLLTGGGANIITSEKVKGYLNNNFIVSLKEPEYADVRGAQNVNYYLDLLL
jgi:hypothetical protein